MIDFFLAKALQHKKGKFLALPFLRNCKYAGMDTQVFVGLHLSPEEEEFRIAERESFRAHHARGLAAPLPLNTDLAVLWIRMMGGLCIIVDASWVWLPYISCRRRCVWSRWPGSGSWAGGG